MDVLENVIKAEVIKSESSCDGPPLLTREIYDDVEEEDIFQEMDEESLSDMEEVSCIQEPSSSTRQPIPQNLPAEQILGVEGAYELARSRPKYVCDQSKYMIEYRDPQFRTKSKNTHKVAIVIKVDENLCHEFSYNRTSDYDGTKYYTCLGCRKAKNDTFKDTIRTIRIDERYRQVMSKMDPFSGHHLNCQPLAWTPDTRSYGHIHPQPMHMDLGEYAPSEYVYMDADGPEEQGIWETSDAQGVLNLAAIPFYGEEGPPPSNLVKENPPHTRQGAVRRQRRPASVRRKKNGPASPLSPKCHLCFRKLPSTERLIRHLQFHLDQQKGADLR